MFNESTTKTKAGHTTLEVKVSQNNINKVLFIAGTGRSGSTLLDMLLGQIDGFCSTGELRFIWDRGFQQNQLCGCGKPFRKCEFWIDVVQEAFGGFQNIDPQRLSGLRKPAEQAHRLSIWSSFRDSADLLAPYQEYFDAYRILYQAICKVSGCEIIIDSSKYIAHGFNLASIPGIDLFTVHLARDSRAVAYSWRRKKVRPEIYWEQQFMSQRGFLKSIGRWNRFNLLAHKLQDVSKGYTFLRYEDLVANPKDKLSRILSDLEVETTSLDFLDGSRANVKTSHTVSGNPMRFERKEIKIQLDTQWQTDMAKYHKLLVTFLTWPLLLKYGYLKNSRYNVKAV